MNDINEWRETEKWLKTERPATREEILGHYRDDRVSFETYVREFSDCRTWNGVRHVCRGTAKVRNVNGVPTVRNHGRDYELFASHFTFPDGQSMITLPTIIKR